MVSTDVFIHSFIFCYEYPGCWFALNFNALVHLRKRTDLQFFSDVSCYFICNIFICFLMFPISLCISIH